MEDDSSGTFEAPFGDGGREGLGVSTGVVVLDGIGVTGNLSLVGSIILKKKAIPFARS